MRYVKKLPAFNGVAAGQTANLRLPTGIMYEEIFISYTGVTLAQMSRVVVYANNKVIYDRSAADTDLINQYDGFAAAAGILRIPFYRKGLKTRAMHDLTLLPTLNAQGAANVIHDFRVEIEIDVAATAPAIEGEYSHGLNKQQMDLQGNAIQLNEAGAILYRNSITFTMNSGETEINTLPRGSVANTVLNRLFIKPSGVNTISKIRLLRDNNIEYEADTDKDARRQSDGDAGRVPQTANGLYALDPTANGHGTDLIALSGNDLRLVITGSGAGTVEIFPEYIGALGQ